LDLWPSDHAQVSLQRWKDCHQGVHGPAPRPGRPALSTIAGTSLVSVPGRERYGAQADRAGGERVPARDLRHEHFVEGLSHTVGIGERARISWPDKGRNELALTH